MNRHDGISLEITIMRLEHILEMHSHVINLLKLPQAEFPFNLHVEAFFLYYLLAFNSINANHKDVRVINIVTN